MTYQSIYNVFLMHTIGKKKVQKINEKDIDSILQSIKEYKANYQNKVLMLIKSTLKWSVKRLGVKCKIIDYIEIGSKSKTKFHELIDPGTFYKFLYAVPQDTYKIFFLTLYLTGARKGEIQGLLWKDINFEKSYIEITKQWNNKASKIDKPKTESSIRRVFIPQTLITALKGLKNNQKQGLNTFVFGNDKHFSSTQIDRIKNQACKKANIEPFRIHSLRHTYASLLIHSNANITIVAELLGHKNIEETLHTYAHMLPNIQLQTIQKLDEIIKSGIN